MRYLLKSEPNPRLEDGVDVSYPFSRLLKESDQSTSWEGVRNAVAGKTLKGMQIGEEAFWYHSNTKRPEIVGIVKVTQAGLVDEVAFDSKSPYYDAKSSREKPRWFMPIVKYSSTLPHPVPLVLLQNLAFLAASTSDARSQVFGYLTDAHLTAISQMDLIRLGRLSVQKVSDDAWEAVCELAKHGEEWEEWLGQQKKGGSKAKATTKRSAEGKSELDGEETTSKKSKGSKPSLAAGDKDALSTVKSKEETPTDGLRRSSRSKKG